MDDVNFTCAPDEDISKMIKANMVQIVLYKKYFDENEFDKSPIKT